MEEDFMDTISASWSSYSRHGNSMATLVGKLKQLSYVLRRWGASKRIPNSREKDHILPQMQAIDQASVRVRLGHGWCTLFWQDRWCGEFTLEETFSALAALSSVPSPSVEQIFDLTSLVVLGRLEKESHTDSNKLKSLSCCKTTGGEREKKLEEEASGIAPMARASHLGREQASTTKILNITSQFTETQRNPNGTLITLNSLVTKDERDRKEENFEFLRVPPKMEFVFGCETPRQPTRKALPTRAAGRVPGGPVGQTMGVSDSVTG
ncbi:hypothetical protein Taro_040199 [Colocasia esculenta]|uniref:Uncharacterized protein n=1 Tax=Colocasia esculenta TaxID=4460 RepID=A0A843WCJ6_COLES|nr:hypothetical protein [Colocasia esculenta]